MNAIIIGNSTKMAGILSEFCEKVYISIDNSFRTRRYIKEIENYEVLNCEINISTIKGVIPKAWKIKKWIKQYDISIIFSQTKYDMLAAKLASIITRKKIILLGTSHNSYSWLDDKNVKKMSWLIRLSTHCYVALASFVYDKLIRHGIKEKNIILVPNIVEHEAWAKKTDYSIDKTFRMVYVAHVYPGKRQDFIVDVLKELKDYDIVVDCYGDTDVTEYVDYIKEKVALSGLEGKVNLKGRIENSELRDMLKRYDAYISPSQMEMSPVNILEAQAAGLPVIASNVGGVPDLVKDNCTGLLFECDNVSDAAAKINLLINNEQLRKRIGKAGLKFVSEEYTLKQAGSIIENKIKTFK